MFVMTYNANISPVTYVQKMYADAASNKTMLITTVLTIVYIAYITP